MKILRNKVFRRSFSLTILIAIVTNLVVPSVSYALTNGPSQPEYANYEEAGASDMVNLLSGDFNFNLPILTVPNGEDNGFTVPLTYHSGIGVENEASWVGLGFGLNVGSLVRTINGFPDDANEEQQTISVQDLSGVRGWNASFLGTTLGWNSAQGHYGVINLGTKISYANGKVTSVGLAGLSVGKGGLKFDPEEFAITVVQAAMIVATYGAASASNIGMQIAMDISVQAVLDAATPKATPNAGSAGNWAYSKRTDHRLFHSNYWIWLDQTRIEDMYGTLNLDKAPSMNAEPFDYGQLTLKHKINTGTSQTLTKFKKRDDSLPNTYHGAASDINIDLSTSDYTQNNSPALLATDNFYVNAPGVSGTIKPYRMELGSVSVPREMSTSHVRFNPLPYLDYGAKKVPFVYEGAQGVGYYNHVGGSSSLTAPVFYNGLSSDFDNSSSTLTLNFNDVIASDRIKSTLSDIKRLPQGNNIQWLTNDEIKQTVTGTNTGEFTGTKFLDFTSGQTRSLFRQRFDFGGSQPYSASNSYFNNGVIELGARTSDFQVDQIVDVNVFAPNPGSPISTILSYPNVKVTQVTSNTITVASTSYYFPLQNFDTTRVAVTVYTQTSQKPKHGIGGFVITGSDGMNYHFSLPSYEYDFKTEQIRIDDETKKSRIERKAAFANNWLLTGITGPDYVDRGPGNKANGTIDESDWGYWVKFNYVRSNVDYQWRLPYAEGSYKYDEKNECKSYATGKRENYYLNSIETPTHIALFLKSDRDDGKGVNKIGTTLRLDEIFLITKGTYNQLLASGWADHRDRIDRRVGGPLLSPTKEILEANAIKRIQFTYDYSLCPGTPNSDAGGKLTLKRISVLGRNNAKVFPDYKFEYTPHNPVYDANRWDGWGIYTSSGTLAGYTHAASSSLTDAYAWNLNKITTPEGQQILIDYERDTYSAISEQRVLGPSYPTYLPTAIPIGERSLNYVYITGNFDLSVGDIVSIDGSVSYYCPSQYPTATTSGTSGFYKVTAINGNKVTLDANYLVLQNCYSAQDLQVSSSGTIAKIVSKPGGNLRVRSITSKDPNGTSNKMIYKYDKPDGTSSGVVAQEPEYIRGSRSYPFYNVLGYPVTNVIYSRVSVLTGPLSTDNDFYSRQVYEFETPRSDQYQLSSVTSKSKELVKSFTTQVSLVRHYQSQAKYELTDKTSQIGKLKSVIQYDNLGNVVYSKSLTYMDTNNDGSDYFGLLSEGTLIYESLRDNADYVVRTKRTSALRYPYILKSVAESKDGFTQSLTHTKWDKISGAIIESISSNSRGVRTLTERVPLYSVYPELGSAAYSSDNKNMLTQIAATYEYRLDNQNRRTGLLSATATRWKKDWSNYRTLAGNEFIDSPDLDANLDGVTSPSELKAQVWRKSDQYLWVGAYARLSEDGAQQFAEADKFSFTPNASIPSTWSRIGTFARYLHNSRIIEFVDKQGFYVSRKYGFGGNVTMASAENAKYTEIAYSGAEEPVAGNYLNDEILKGDGVVVSSNSHTGKYSVQLLTGKSMIFKSKGLSAKTKYKASVWCSNANGRVYYKINNGIEVVSSAPPSDKLMDNGWFLLDVVIPEQASAFDIEVGVKTGTGSSVLFDDFRFQPRDASLVTFVYDPVDFKVLFVLDNQNLFIQYEYNDVGQVVRTKGESLKSNKVILINEYSKNFRRFSVDQ